MNTDNIKDIKDTGTKKTVPVSHVSGDRACRRMMQQVRRHQQQKPDPEAASILAWARYEFTKELLCGFWERKAA